MRKNPNAIPKGDYRVQPPQRIRVGQPGEYTHFDGMSKSEHKAINQHIKKSLGKNFAYSDFEDEVHHTYSHKNWRGKKVQHTYLVGHFHPHHAAFHKTRKSLGA